VFLDKELRRIAPEVPGGSLVADHLVQVHRKSGEIRWVLVHIEVQSQKVSDFARRMLQYHLRILQRHENRPVCSLAILGDPGADWRPEAHDQALWGTRLRFEFPVVKLFDYRGRLSELERSCNPFALLVAATLHVHVTSPKDPRRRKAKLRLVTGLYDAGLCANEIRAFFRLVDWVMTLSDEQKELFEHELADYERSHNMPYITSIERSAMAKGLEQGREQGREEGRQLGREEALRAAISRLLETRFGKVPDEVAAWLDTLDQAERLLELVTAAATAETLQAWRAEAQASS
jgi:hypothetical protein